MNSESVFNGEKMTRREVEIAREAFKAGAEYNYNALVERNRTSPRTTAMLDHTETKWEARRRWPLPITVRPRVVRDPHSPQCDWKVVCSCLTVRVGALPANASFQNYPRSGESVYPTHERCKLWADLLANPNETVEE